MALQKYQVDQIVILLDSNSNLPFASAVILNYEESKQTYRIGYKGLGEMKIRFDQVPECRLTTLVEFVEADFYC